VSEWVEDIARAVREGRELSGSSMVRLLGVQAGALLACRSVGASSDVQRLVLRDAVADGAVRGNGGSGQRRERTPSLRGFTLHALGGASASACSNAARISLQVEGSPADDTLKQRTCSAMRATASSP
jgi:hypothetical protein